MRLALAVGLATMSGFIALSQEIVWFRVYSFFTWSRSSTFGFLLGAYLTGLALGAWFARRFCRPERGSEVRALAEFLFVSSVAGLLVVPFVAELGTFLPGYFSLIAFAGVAGLLGTALPLISHFAIPPGDRVGARLSYLYLGNILGSSAGSLLTGFILLDHFPLRVVVVVIFWVAMAMTAGALLLGNWSPGRTRASLGFIVFLSVAALPASGLMFNGVYEKLTFKDEYISGLRFRHVSETRSGVVTVDTEGIVRGGAVYDGRFNVDPLDDVNGIVRAYALFAVRPAPRTVCVVGLGSGSWAQVIANHRSVEKVTVIEINPGYLDIVATSPVVSSLLTNPRVEFVIDDGRRWLARTDRTFDAIVQNTTYHWRAHATNLLSREYLELCRRRLSDDGVIVYNTTKSLDAVRTGLEVFPHAWLLERAMIVSDAALAPDFAAWRRMMGTYRIDGALVAEVRTGLEEKAFERLLDSDRWEPRAALSRRARNAVVITDDNMASEWQ